MHEYAWQEVSATVTGVDGLHARPAIRFSRAAKGYAARIQIRGAEEAPWVDAKSVAKVMALQVERGRTIHRVLRVSMPTRRSAGCGSWSKSIWPARTMTRPGTLSE